MSTTTTRMHVVATGLNGYGFTWHPDRSEWVGENTDTSGREFDADEMDLEYAIAAAKGTLLEGIALLDINEGVE